MKTIRNLTVKVTYTVELQKADVSDEVYKALQECHEECNIIQESRPLDEVQEKAHRWLMNNMFEMDATDRNYEIEEFDE